MTEEQLTQMDTNQLIQEMMKQMTALQEKVEAIQKNPSSGDSNSRQKDSDDEGDDSSGRLVQLTETTKSFLEAAFSGTMSNEDRRKRVKKVGVPDCDQVHCPKLDGVLKMVLPQGRHKGGWVFIASSAVLAGRSGSPSGSVRER